MIGLTKEQLDALIRAPWAFGSSHLSDILTALVAEIERLKSMNEHEPYVSAKDYRDLAAELNKMTIERDDWRERAGSAGIRRERAEALHHEELGRINRAHADAIAGIGVTLDQAQRNSQSWEKRARAAEEELDAIAQADEGSDEVEGVPV